MNRILAGILAVALLGGVILALVYIMGAFIEVLGSVGVVAFIGFLVILFLWARRAKLRYQREHPQGGTEKVEPSQGKAQ